MTEFKLTYFNSRGLAEPARLIFALAGVEYEDERLTLEDWQNYVKPTTKWGLLPFLTIDGKMELGQAATIARFLARKFKLIGENEMEAALADEIVDAIDVHNEFQKWFYAKEGEEKEAATKRFIELNHGNIVNLELIKQHNGGDWIVGKNLTWADLVVASLYYDFSNYLDVDLLAGYPNLKAHQAGVFALPRIRAWLEKRPKTQF